ncbi:hypothetical protein M422DRAFT_274659 [Sphaerobolus stellatus SS14]|uniref:Uncharacterized protein n=1 Tax=Sphaerobolus stellatus (strain SS14) TaxID=990650 RepID=A0A0C9TRN3_SPHS4|nr:hypothetical protein M422DRAFT_274659 [Sphaerobolus stellatus SS14]
MTLASHKDISMLAFYEEPATNTGTHVCKCKSQGPEEETCPGSLMKEQALMLQVKNAEFEHWVIEKAREWGVSTLTIMTTWDWITTIFWHKAITKHEAKYMDEDEIPEMATWLQTKELNTHKQRHSNIMMDYKALQQEDEVRFKLGNTTKLMEQARKELCMWAAWYAMCSVVLAGFCVSIDYLDPVSHMHNFSFIGNESAQKFFDDKEVNMAQMIYDLETYCCDGDLKAHQKAGQENDAQLSLKYAIESKNADKWRSAISEMLCRIWSLETGLVSKRLRWEEWGEDFLKIFKCLDGEIPVADWTEEEIKLAWSASCHCLLDNDSWLAIPIICNQDGNMLLAVGNLEDEDDSNSTCNGSDKDSVVETSEDKLKKEGKAKKGKSSKNKKIGEGNKWPKKTMKSKPRVEDSDAEEDAGQSRPSSFKLDTGGRGLVGGGTRAGSQPEGHAWGAGGGVWKDHSYKHEWSNRDIASHHDWLDNGKIVEHQPLPQVDGSRGAPPMNTGHVVQHNIPDSGTAPYLLSLATRAPPHHIGAPLHHTGDLPLPCATTPHQQHHADARAATYGQSGSTATGIPALTTPYPSAQPCNHYGLYTGQGVQAQDRQLHRPPSHLNSQPLSRPSSRGPHYGGPIPGGAAQGHSGMPQMYGQQRCPLRGGSYSGDASDGGGGDGYDKGGGYSDGGYGESNYDGGGYGRSSYGGGGYAGGYGGDDEWVRRQSQGGGDYGDGQGYDYQAQHHGHMPSMPEVPEAIEYRYGHGDYS